MRQCAVCGKSYIRARSRKKLRGNYNPTPWRRKKANLQKTRLPESGKRAFVCTQCLKTLSTKAAAKASK